MKKTNLLKGALSVLAVSVLLASCTQVEVDSRIDTIDTLGTPSVKAVAYPGVNYIAWNAVKGASGYKVTRIVDGGVEEIISNSQSNTYVTDFLSIDNVDVEYKVYALSDTEPSSAREVYVYGSEAGSATVTNIFPPVGTEAKDLPKYEKDSGWKFETDADNSEWKDEFIPTAENIDIQYVDGTIEITAPTKAYLTTKVVGYTGNKEEIFFNVSNLEDLRVFLPSYQNKMISGIRSITSAGEYKFKAEIKAYWDGWDCGFYKTSNITLKTVKVPGIETSKSTSDPEVAYIDDAKTTARVVFTPAVSKDGKTTYPVENYKVYRALSGTKQLDEVTGLKADSRTTTNGKTEVIYVVDDTVPTNTVAYDYYVVLNVDGSLEVGEKKNTLAKAEGIETSDSTGNLNVAYIDDAKTTARVVFTPAVSKDGITTYPVENYKVYRALSGTEQLEEVTGLKADSRTTNGKKEVIYVVEDKVPTNTVAYDYYVVLNVNGCIERIQFTLPKEDLSAGNGGSITGLSFTEFDDDKRVNDIVAKVTPISGSKIVSVSYAFSTLADKNKVLDSAYKAQELVVEPKLAETDQAFLIKDVPENNYVFVRAEFAEIEPTGKVNSVVVNKSDKCTVGKATQVDIKFAAPTQKEGDTDCLINDWIGNEIDVNGGELVSVKYGKAKNADLAKVAAINGTEVKFAVKDYDQGSNNYDYVFDIPDAGEVGEYIAIAAEVKAEGKKNNLKVVAYTNSAVNSAVKISDNLPLVIDVPDPSPILDPKEPKYDVVLKVDISKAVYDANNSADNYDSVEISYIKTNKNYEIKNDTEWSEVKKFNFNELSKDEIKVDGKTVGNKYSTTHIITNKTYSATASTSVTEYYVIKVVPKYKVPGAKVDEKIYKRAFTYYK